MRSPVNWKYSFGVPSNGVTPSGSVFVYVFSAVSASAAGAVNVPSAFRTYPALSRTFDFSP